LLAGLVLGQPPRTETREVTSTTTSFHKGTLLTGATVVVRDGATVGRVEDFVITEGGCVDYVVVSYENKYVFVPWTVTHWTADKTIRVDVTRDKFVAAPTFTRDRWPAFTDTRYFDQVRTAFGVSESRSRGAPRREDDRRPLDRATPPDRRDDRRDSRDDRRDTTRPPDRRDNQPPDRRDDRRDDAKDRRDDRRDPRDQRKDVENPSRPPVTNPPDRTKDRRDDTKDRRDTDKDRRPPPRDTDKDKDKDKSRPPVPPDRPPDRPPQ